ncbi:MAG: hypothetical protein ABIR79_04105, partial [Candidatus Binatia bacterium]
MIDRGFKSVWVVGVLMITLAAPSASWAWYIQGRVYCDNGNGFPDAGDTSVDGVTVTITSQTASPGTTFTGPT